jgi:hypothetical protein
VSRPKVLGIALLDFSGDPIFAEFEMSDDPDDQEARAKDALPPFVQNDDSSHLIAAAHAQRRMNPALYNIDNQPPLPLLVLGGKVLYVDFGFSSAREYWTEVAEPAHHRFVKDKTRGNAIAAFLLLWPLHDWLWHEQHPGEDTRNSRDYEQFRQQLFGNCPELAWLRDVADAGKHRGLGRSNIQVREVAKTWPSNTQPLKIVLDDGSEHNIADVLLRIVEYFRKTHFLT